MSALQTALEQQLNSCFPGYAACETCGPFCLANILNNIITGAIFGSGTLNYIPLWTPDGNSLGNSYLHQSGNQLIGIAGGGMVTLDWTGSTTGFIALFPNKSGSQTFAFISDIPSSLPPSGAAGGDLSGTYPNPSVVWANGETTYDARYVKLSGATMSGLLILSGNPVSGNGAATKNYVDSAIQGLSQKPTADVATTTALPANVYNNGASGVGATLTGFAFGAFPTVDGVAPYLNMLVLVKNEVATANNGLYVLTTVGTVAAAYVLTRHTDMSLAADFDGALIPVDNEGSTNANTLWIMNYVASFVTGTSAVTFSQVGGTSYTGGTGITVSGTVISLASGVCTPGTYQSVTVDTYGRVTAGSTLTNNYQTIEQDGAAKTQRAALNFTYDFKATDNAGNGSTDIRLKGKSKLYIYHNY